MTVSAGLRLLRPVIGLGLLAWLLSSINLAELANLAVAGRPEILVAAAGALFVSLFFQALRLHILVRRLTASFMDSMRLFLVGMAFNNVLPSAVGGDAVRLMYLRKMRPGGLAAPLGLLLVHRVSGLVVLLVAAAAVAGSRADVVSRVLSWRSVVPAVWWAALVAALVAGLAVLLAGPLRKRVRKAVANARAAIAELAVVDWINLLVFTVAFHGLRLVALSLGVEYFGSQVEAVEVVLVLAIVAVVSLLPISVGGLGLVEGSIALTLTAFGVPAPAAAGVALLNRLVLLVVAGMGGIVYALDRPATGPSPAPGT
jgi:uncharacterized membrane protein YbhN (UPF0104 family)